MLRLVPMGLIGLLSLIVGCSSGSNGPTTYSVSGTVKFDGQPLKTGDILFEPETPGLAPDAGQIANGSYALKAKAGKMKVKITASREIPGKVTKGAMGEDIVAKEDFIPANYNSQTELSAEVKPSGSNTFNFDLQGTGAGAAK